ncbi:MULTISPECIES: pyridoxal phosphate-dependent aminotransferase [unclassified Sphingomonas]|jgi:histidinol-phosphate aminotransferase|uniref:pyridoxal phosphate-dependent aminotransferase n=1 Tax=unclassified Sphingomonas TaxID=196159 RepID=UPI00082D9C56|nr:MULTISPECIES: histidinol-phosphate transaminase [unclassified Sphingomonas]
MSIELSRRAWLGAAAVAGGGAIAATRSAYAFPSAEPPVFGPAPGVALLSRNENPFGPAPSAIRAMADAAGKGCYYSDGGLRRLTDMIAERFAVSRDHVVIGNGSTEVLSAIALAYKDKGAILGADLFWDTTVQYAERQGAKVLRVPLAADMGVDLDAMAAAVTPDIALVHLCNPNNPTGMLIDGDQVRAFVRKVGPKATVLVDEAYNELTDRPEHHSVADLVKAGENVVVCRTFSKIYGMAGLRVGYALARPEVAKRVSEHLMSFGGNSAGLAAAIGSYGDIAFLNYSKARIVEGRGMIMDAVKAAGLAALPSQTNFVFVKVPDANAVQKAMAARSVMIRGSYGKWTQWSRVSTGRIEDVQRYAAALPEIMRA